MAVVRVMRTKDRRWRLEVHGDGRRVLIHLGAVILADASMDEIGRRMADDGVDPADLFED